MYDIKHNGILNRRSRHIGGVVTAAGLSANDMILWSFIVLPISIITYGAGQCFVAVGLFVGNVFNWLFLARRIKAYQELSKKEIYNASDFMSVRYGARGLNYILAISWMIILMFILYLVLTYVAKIIGGHTNKDSIIYIFIILVALVAIISVADGKFFLIGKAVTYITILGIVIALIVLIFIHFSPTGILDIYRKCNLPGGTRTYLDIMYYDGKAIQVTDIISMVSAALGSIGFPFFFGGILRCRDSKEVDKSRVLGMLISGISVITVSFFALLSIVTFYPVKAKSIKNSYEVFNKAINALSADYKYGVLIKDISIGVYLLALIFFAGSLLLMIAELLRGIIPSVRIGRIHVHRVYVDILIISIVVSIVLLMYLYSDLDAISIIVRDWDVCGGVFAAPLICGILYDKSTKTGIYSGFFAGALTYGLISYIPVVTGLTIPYVSDIDEGVFAFAVNMIVILVVSRFTKKPDSKQLRLLEQVKISQR